MSPRRPTFSTCRGFGERRGSCENLPGVRTVQHERGAIHVPSLCDACDLVRIQTGVDIARAEGRLSRQDSGRITGLEFGSLDSEIRTTARRIGR